MNIENELVSLVCLLRMSEPKVNWYELQQPKKLTNEISTYGSNQQS